jgi:hypothetical protein
MTSNQSPYFVYAQTTGAHIAEDCWTHLSNEHCLGQALKTFLTTGKYICRRSTVTASRLRLQLFELL